VAAAVRNGLTKEFIDVVEHFAENLEASSSQLRNVFSFIKQLQAREFDPEDLLMLRPRLAYAATRERKLQDLRDVLSPAIDAVAEVGGEEAKSRFERFCRCCEAIIAYAKR
jgi:CRISPR-associated protein Csm2